MLDCIGRTGKPIILSSGMSDWKELENTIGFLRDYSSQLFLLQCTTAYPTKPEQWGLGVMKEMRERFTLPVGFSDHSADIFAGLAAATLGAEILEFHAAFHHNMFGPDAKASLTPEQIKQLVKGVREINNSLRDSVSKSNVDSFGTLKIMFGKSLALRRYMQAGEILNVSDLESKKPGDQGIPACLFKEVLGKKLNKELPANAFLNLRDLKDEKN
jgi:N-acetylneuraminate synthase